MFGAGIRQYLLGLLRRAAESEAFGNWRGCGCEQDLSAEGVALACFSMALPNFGWSSHGPPGACGQRWNPARLAGEAGLLASWSVGEGGAASF